MDPTGRVVRLRRAAVTLLALCLPGACGRSAPPQRVVDAQPPVPAHRLMSSPQDTARDGIYRPFVRLDFRLGARRQFVYPSYDFLDPDVRRFLRDTTVNVPEFHDAQRVRRPCGMGSCLEEYYPDDELKLTAIAGLADVTDAQFEQPKGHPVGMLHVFASVPVPEFGVQAMSSNPIWIRKTPSVDEWFADVYDGLNPVPTVAKTFVVDAVIMGTGNDTVPAVAQWDWSDRPANGGAKSTPLAGFRCGKYRWCEFGHPDPYPGFSKRNPWCDKGDPFTCRVKGWYDDQQLAVKNSAGMLRPGPYAVIFPVPNLKAVAMDDVPTVFTRVATIRSERDYDGAVRLEGRHWWAEDNELYLTRGTDGNFYLKIVRSPFPLVKRWETYEVRFHDHSSDGKWVPPVVRWGWLWNDEGLWTPCGAGCCELQGRRDSGTGDGPEAQ